MFKEIIKTTDFSELYEIETSQYFKDITTIDLDYWDVHERMFSNIDKDAKILDVGVWFGVIPWALKKLGYSNVDCTECLAHSQSKRDSFDLLWKKFNISPFELHIEPKTLFTLPTTYDVITMTKSNVFWKTQEVIHYDGTDVKTEWQVFGDDQKHHTFFTLYDTEDWQYFIENAKKFLNPGGKLLLNPEPWSYDKIDYYKDTNEFLKPYYNGSYLEITK